MKKYSWILFLFLSTILYAQTKTAAPIAGLPPGLTFSSIGTLSGTPTTAGVYQFNIQVCDSEAPPQCATTQFNVTVFLPISINPMSLPYGVVGIPYPNTQFGVTGGIGPYVWSNPK